MGKFTFDVVEPESARMQAHMFPSPSTISRSSNRLSTHSSRSNPETRTPLSQVDETSLRETYEQLLKKHESTQECPQTSVIRKRWRQALKQLKAELDRRTTLKFVAERQFYKDGDE